MSQLFPTFHLQSRWYRPYVVLVTLLGAGALAAALQDLFTQPYQGPSLGTVGLLAVIAAVTASLRVLLPEGNTVRPFQAGLLPAVFIAGWPLAPLLASFGRMVAVCLDYRRELRRSAEQRAFYWATELMSCAIPALTTSAACWWLTELPNESWSTLLVTIACLFLLDDLLALHALSLAGWQFEREGGVAKRWEAALRLWRKVSVSYPTVLATGYFFTVGIQVNRYDVVLAASAAALSLPLLLRQGSWLLARQSKSSLLAVDAMEKRDPYTKGHTDRVTEVTIQIQREMGAPFSEQEVASLACPIHDLGKIDTPDEILQKDGEHTPAQRKTMEGHVDDDMTGERRWWGILIHAPWLRWFIELIEPGVWVKFVRRCHHLRIDGTGYPASIQQAYVVAARRLAWFREFRRLGITLIGCFQRRGFRLRAKTVRRLLRLRVQRRLRPTLRELIPLVARVMAVADTWDAMTSDRCYRDGMAVEVVLQKMTDARHDPRYGQTYGGQLDTDCVDALVRLVKAGKVVPNDTRTDEIDEIFGRFEQPTTRPGVLYLAGTLTAAAVTWLVASLPQIPLWAGLVVILPLGRALWVNGAALREADEFLARLSLEADRRAGYVDPRATEQLAGARHYQAQLVQLLEWFLEHDERCDQGLRKPLLEAARLLNVGTLAISDTVLTQPTALSEAERALVNHHPTGGSRLLAGSASDEARYLIALHHERWDGRGYPFERSGTEIPLGARLLRLAEAFAALGADRPYRPAHSPHQALAVLHEDREAYDPQLLELLEQYVAARWPDATDD